MKFKGLIAKLSGIAPTMATGLGGPLAGVAVKTVMKSLHLGDDASPEDIEKAVDLATPEQMSNLRQADLDFKVRMKELDIDLVKTQTADIQDARKTFGNDPVPKLFAMVALLGFLGYVFMVTIQPPDANDDGVVNLILGYLGGLVSGISAFFFGGSNGK
jgi:hypothetical protein